MSAGHRARLHQGIGLRKEAVFGAEAPTTATELARHFTQAQDARWAVGYLCQAADTVMRQQAYQDARQHCTAGLALLAARLDTAESRQQELALQTTLGVALMTLKGYADPDVGRAYARVLCQQVEDTPVLWGLWLYDFARGALRSGTAVGGVIRLSTVTGGRGHIWTSRPYRRMLS